MEKEVFLGPADASEISDEDLNHPQVIEALELDQVERDFVDGKLPDLEPVLLELEEDPVDDSPDLRKSVDLRYG